MIPFFRKNPVLAIVSLAVIVRVVIFLLGTVDLSSGDFPLFERMANNLLTQGNFGGEPAVTYGSPNINPGFALWIALLYLIFDQSTTVFWAGQIVLGALLVWGSYLLATKVFDKRVGLITAFVIALWPTLILISTESTSVLLFSSLFLFSVIFFFKALSCQTVLNGIISGIFLGLATLTKSIFFYAPIILGLWLFGMVILKKIEFRRASILLIAFTLSFSATLTPWTIRNIKVAGTNGSKAEVLAKGELRIVSSSKETELIFKNLAEGNILFQGLKQMFLSPYGIWHLDRGPVEETIVYKSLIFSVLRGEQYSPNVIVVLGLKIFIFLFHWALLLLTIYSILKFKFRRFGSFVFMLLAYTIFAAIGFVAHRGGFYGVSHLSLFIVPFVPLFAILASATIARRFPSLLEKV